MLARVASGWRRLSLTLEVIGATLLACLLFAYLHPVADLWLAIGIFVISTLGFSLLAWLTSAAVNAWKAADYFWTLSALIGILMALATARESQTNGSIETAKLQYLAYLAAAVVEAESLRAQCSTPAGLSSLQKAACNGFDKFLRLAKDETGQIRDKYGPPTLLGDPQRLMGVIKVSWWDVLIPAKTVIEPNSKIWALLKVYIDRADALKEEYVSLKFRTIIERNAFQAELDIIGRHYWFFILPFFAGLRLSKTTAEIFHAAATDGGASESEVKTTRWPAIKGPRR